MKHRFWIPSIFPNTGGINEFFPKNYSLSFEQYDYENLKTKLKLLTDTNQLREIGIKNKNFLNLLLDNEKMASTFNKFYENINSLVSVIMSCFNSENTLKSIN